MLELCNVNMLFRQKKIKINVLKNINLVLPNTGLVIIKGPSGVGKTTLLNIISGLKKPSKGYIKYNCEMCIILHSILRQNRENGY